jgi:low affinity Fe/Cu permease
MGQLQKIPITITGFIFLEHDQSIEDIQEKLDNNTVSIDFDGNEEPIEIEYATITEQE